MHLFYTPQLLLTSSPAIDSTEEVGAELKVILLSEDESKHCIRVLRLTTGNKIILIDGKGGWYEAEISDDNPKRCAVSVIKTKTEFGKRNFHLQIAIAPTKNMDRLEWFVEKAVEIGIDEFSIINCKNSERTIVKTERLNKVAVAAIKQSLKAYLPAINEVIDFKKFIAATNSFSGQKFIAHCYKDTINSHLKNLYHPGNDALILIGPEGDFSIDEVKLAVDSGFKEISLGESRLRTETAALYACTTINILNEGLDNL